MNSTAPRTAVAVAVALLALGGCGGSSETASTVSELAPSSSRTATSVESTTTAPSAAPDACTVITPEQAGQVVGLTLQPGVKSGSGEEQMCQFTADPNGPTGQVSVFIGPGGPEKQLQIDRDTLGHEFTQLPGLGDEAWIEQDNIFIRKGGLWASVNVVSLDAPPEQVQDGLKTLAGVIVAQM